MHLGMQDGKLAPPDNTAMEPTPEQRQPLLPDPKHPENWDDAVADFLALARAVAEDDSEAVRCFGTHGSDSQQVMAVGFLKLSLPSVS